MGWCGGNTGGDPVGPPPERGLALLAALLFTAAFFRHSDVPPLLRKVAKTARRVYREASAAWHVGPRVTERLALVLTLE